MKTFISTILSGVLLFTLSACGTSSEGKATQNQSQPETSSKAENSSTSNHTSENPTQSKPTIQNTQASSAYTSGSNENNQSEEFFYGQWQIKKVIAFGPAGTYSTDDVNALTGKPLSFSKESATCFGDKIEDMNNVAANPVYKKRVIAKSAFPSEYRVTFDQLGIAGDSVTELDATDTNGICTVTFITPVKNKLILYGGGTFFEMVKNNDTSSDGDAENQAAIEEANQNKAVSLVKEYLRGKNELVEDKNHFVQFEETYNDYYIIRYSTLVSGHSSTNGRYGVDIDKGKVTDITDATDLTFLNN
ncbi:LptM family lipoprotein [Neobacillus sp. Marseille-QA0830]